VLPLVFGMKMASFLWFILTFLGKAANYFLKIFLVSNFIKLQDPSSSSNCFTEIESGTSSSPKVTNFTCQSNFLAAASNFGAVSSSTKINLALVSLICLTYSSLQIKNRYNFFVLIFIYQCSPSGSCPSQLPLSAKQPLGSDRVELSRMSQSATRLLF